jgi:hypothetical protein
MMGKKKKRKKGIGVYAQQFGNTFCDDIEGKSVIASEAWQSLREKCISLYGIASLRSQ